MPITSRCLNNGGFCDARLVHSRNHLLGCHRPRARPVGLMAAERRQRISAYLDTYWFVSGVRTSYFPTTPVARIYAEGVLETLELSLKGSRRPVPINSWWVLDADDFKMLNLADLKDGVTVGGYVTLLIMTPRPGRSGRAVPPWILGVEAEAYVTERQGRAVTTRRVRDL